MSPFLILRVLRLNTQHRVLDVAHSKFEYSMLATLGIEIEKFFNPIDADRLLDKSPCYQVVTQFGGV